MIMRISLYKTEAGKFRAVVNRIDRCRTKKASRCWSVRYPSKRANFCLRSLKNKGSNSEVLNAKYHEKEAQIIAQAGKYGAVTIATNMAGRGTDIMLGGNAEYIAKNDLIKAGYSEEAIVEAMGYAETEDEQVIEAARAMFQKGLEKL